MDIVEINNLLSKEKYLIFSAHSEPHALFYIGVDVVKNKIVFTTDVPTYSGKNIDEIIEYLFQNYTISKFLIMVHHHPGKFHDKDIIFTVQKEKTAAVISEIMTTFYKPGNWISYPPKNEKSFIDLFN